MEVLPAALTLEPEGSFARRVFHERHPALVRQLCASHPYTLKQRRALTTLLEESASDAPIPSLPDDAPDRALWEEWDHGHIGRPWAKASFLWAESYFYRQLLEAVDFFTPGDWYRVDPFGPMKVEELCDPSLESDFAWLDRLDRAVPHAAFNALLLACLYGNRADLGFRFDARGQPEHVSATQDQLVADDSAALWSFLAEHAPQRICFVADNAGRELLADLLLIDHFLSHSLATEVALHVKPLPYYVSDASVADVGTCLRRLAAMPGEASAAGHRIQDAAANDRVQVRAHPFYCAPLSFRHMPEDLANEFRKAELTIFKGDLNYRRIVGDRDWDPTVPFVNAASYLPGPAVALRTLKSDVIVGVDAMTVRELDSSDPAWRTNGTRALIQAIL